MQNRLRSKPLWIATFALVIFVLKTYFKIEVPKADELLLLILIVAIEFGIINNPTDKNNI
jgi:uncharacterized membrane protein